MEVWVSDELPGVVLNTKPTFSSLVGRALYPAVCVAFVLLMPIFFIVQSQFDGV